jgi:hypothetical protein
MTKDVSILVTMRVTKMYCTHTIIVINISAEPFKMYNTLPSEMAKNGRNM